MALDLFGGRRLLLAGSSLGWVWIALLAVALLLLLVLYREERRLISRTAGLFLLGLRLLAAVVLVFALFEPIAARTFSETLRGRVLVAVDVSSSMETTDVGRPAEQRATLAKSLALSPGESALPLSRREIAARLLRDPASPIQRLANEHQLEVFAFARDTAPASLDGLRERLRKPADPADPGLLSTNWQPFLAQALKSKSDDSPLIGVVLLTDGRQNAAIDPVPATDRLAARGIPIFPVQIGSALPPRDAAIATLKAPESVYRGDTALIEATIKLDGYDGREVAVTLERAGAPELKRTVRASATAAAARPVVTFPVSFDTVGTVAVTVAVGPLEADARPDNDRRTALVQVIDDKASVLLVDGDARWEFRYLRNALARDPRVSLRTVVLDQPDTHGIIKNTYEKTLPAAPDERVETADPLGAFDLIVLGDVDPAALDSRTWSRLDAYVAERGGTLVLSLGPHHWASLAGQESFRRLSPVFEPHLVPIDSAAVDPAHPALPPGIAVLPRWGRIDAAAWPMLQFNSDAEQNRATWARLPRLPWVVAGRAKPGAIVLAEPSNADSAAVIASVPYGLGKVFWIGTDTWRWRYQSGDLLLHRFWGQVVRWAAAARLAAGNAFVRFGPSRPRVPEGDPVHLQARISDTVPGMISGVLVAAHVYRVDKSAGKGAGEAVAIVPLKHVAGQPRTFAADLPGLAVGVYTIRLDVPELAGSLGLDAAGASSVPEARFEVVERATSERIELAAAREPLDELASATGGRVLADYEAGELPALFRSRTRSIVRTEETPLWNQPAGMVFFMLILTTEWVARKRLGLP
jgi:hypothetical protein